MTPALHFEPRPYTSPCACGADIPLDQTVSLEDPDGNTVCDQCAKRIDPAKAKALEALRAVDETWWRTAEEHGHITQHELQDMAGANEYLRQVVAGIAVIAEFYDPALAQAVAP